MDLESFVCQIHHIQLSSTYQLMNNWQDFQPKNLESERHLAEFGKRAAVAKFRNQHFTAKGIRNDCTLLTSDSFQTKHEKVNKVVK